MCVFVQPAFFPAGRETDGVGGVGGGGVGDFRASSSATAATTLQFNCGGYHPAWPVVGHLVPVRAGVHAKLSAGDDLRRCTN